MRFDIFLFELRRRMRQPSTYVYFLLFAMFGFMGIWRASIGRGLLAGITGAGRGNVEADAPYALYYYITILSAFGLLVAAAWFGGAASRDFRYGAYHLFYTYPIGKLRYLGGKFAAALAGMLFVVGGIGIGGLAAAATPLVDRAGIGRLHVAAFIHPYVLSVLPNLLLAGALFFSIALLTRRFVSVWAGLGAVVVLHLIAVGLARADSRQLAALLDPFGLVAARMIFGYWSIAEKNELLMPLAGPLLANRIVWGALAAAVCVFTYRRFLFLVPEASGSDGAGSSTAAMQGRRFRPTAIASAPRSVKRFSFGDHARRMLRLAAGDFGYLARSTTFYVLLALGLALVLFTGIRNIGMVRGTQTFPVTSQVLEALCDNLYLLGLVITLFCSSALVWRDRNARLQEISDALPVPRWVPLLGKIGAMALVHALLMAVVMVCGMAIQTARGYYDYEPGLYIAELFGVQLLYYVLLSVFALFAQVLTGRRLLGFVVTLFFVDDFMEMFGLEHHLWTYASKPSYVLSDMNGYGPFAPAIVSYDLYWISLALVLLVLTLLLYPRGFDTGLMQRMGAMRRRLSRASMAAVAAGLAGCLVMGGVIVYNTVARNGFETERRVARRKADYEKRYKRWEARPQPHVSAIEARVDLYPEERRMESRGEMRLVNEADSAVDTLFIQVTPEAAVRELLPLVPATPVHADTVHGVYLYVLHEPLGPGEAAGIRYDLGLAERGFKDTGVNTRLVENGTFLTVVELFPATGYDPYGLYELDDNDQREKHGLQRKPRMPSADDAAARMRTPLGAHADWIDFEAVVSTSPDQTALAPGDLLREWEEDGRRFFHYRASRKILGYAAVLSGRYAVRREGWGDHGIEVYYHPRHGRNVDLMIESVKRSFDYFEGEFSPYQFSTVRIVEFPRYELFAEAFPGLIPISEGYGFIAMYDEKRVKEVFRVVAHEAGHQWWAHQVIGADVEGFFVLTEVMAQYSALVVSKRVYERPQFDAYVRYEIDRYLRGRGKETEEEVPLVRTNEETWYQHYAKGFVVMNALAEYIGEERINGAIRAFIGENAFREPPFTTARELVDLFVSAAPDSMRYLVEDCFDRIVLFDNEALAAACERTGDGRYRVTLSFEARKWAVDGSGVKRDEPLRDLIEFAVFAGDGGELCRERRWVDGGTTEITMFVDREPARAGIDPHYLLVDSDTGDNIVPVDMR